MTRIRAGIDQSVRDSSTYKRCPRGSPVNSHIRRGCQRLHRECSGWIHQNPGRRNRRRKCLHRRCILLSSRRQGCNQGPSRQCRRLLADMRRDHPRKPRRSRGRLQAGTRQPHRRTGNRSLAHSSTRYGRSWCTEHIGCSRSCRTDSGHRPTDLQHNCLQPRRHPREGRCLDPDLERAGTTLLQGSPDLLDRGACRN